MVTVRSISWNARNGVRIRMYGCYLRDVCLAMAMFMPMLVRMMCMRLDMCMALTVMVGGRMRMRFVRLGRAGVLVSFEQLVESFRNGLFLSLRKSSTGK